MQEGIAMTKLIAVFKVLAPFAVVVGLMLMGWTVANWHSDSVMYKAKARKAEQDLKTVQNTLKEVQDANDRKEADAKRIEAAAVAARTERDRLRGDLAKVRAKLRAAPAPAVLEYANTVTDVFEQCTKEYLLVAQAADGHAADAANLQRTWADIAAVQ